MARKINTCELSRNPFPDDKRLRDAGWELLLRPDKGEATWVYKERKNGRIVSVTILLESQALARLDKARTKYAEYAK